MTMTWSLQNGQDKKPTATSPRTPDHIWTPAEEIRVKPMW